MLVESRQNDRVKLRQPSHFTDTLRSLSKFRNDCTLCDITIIVSGKHFPAHRNVLAACSEYFKAMFCGSMRESREAVITLESISYEVFEQIMQFIYEGNFTIDMVSALDILHAASMLVLKEMQSECIKYLHNNIDAKNCFSIRDIGNLYSSTLVKDSDEFISKNFEKLVEEEEILNLSHRDLKKLLIRDDIICKQEDTVSGVVEKWLSLRESVALTDVSSLLKAVRFPYLSESGLKCLITTLRGIDAKASPTAVSKNSPDAQFVKTLKTEYKLQLRKKKSNGLDCRMCQCKVPIILCVSLRGEVYCYHMPSKRFRKLDRFPHFWQPSQLVVNNDIVYATGGALKVQDCIYTSDVYAFNPLEGKWTTLQPMTKRRGRHCAAFLDDRLYIIGGKDSQDGYNEISAVSSSVECYHTVKKTWISRASTQKPRIDSCAVATQKYIYVIGGVFPQFSLDNARTVERYDPVKDRWEMMPQLNKGRSGCSAVYINDKIFVWGGVSASGMIDLYDFEYLDPVKNQWVIQTVPHNKPIHSVFCINDKIIVSLKATFGADIYLQYSFVRRNGIKHERLGEFIHQNHRTSNFRYAVTHMLNYDIDRKSEATCDCNDFDDQSTSEDEFQASSDDDDDILDGWLDNLQPFGMFL